jgi:DNA-binding CsgD family transcriptional regulator
VAVLETPSIQAEGARWQFELLAHRALSDEAGHLFILDLDRRAVVWSDCEGERTCSPQFVDELVEAALAVVRSRQRQAAPAPLLAGGYLLQAREVAGGPGPSCPWAACRVRLARDGAPGRLSPQEQRVAHLLSQGYEVINVAAVTGVSEHTVRTYIRRIYRKLRVRNRAELVHALSGAERSR